MAKIIEEAVAVVSDPSLIKFKLFNRWRFGLCWNKICL